MHEHTLSHRHQFAVMDSIGQLPPLIFKVLSVADVAQTAKSPRITFPTVVSPVLNGECNK